MPVEWRRKIHSNIYLLLLFGGEEKKARNISKMSTLLRKSEHLNPFKCQLEPGAGFRGGEIEEVRRGRGN